MENTKLRILLDERGISLFLISRKGIIDKVIFSFYHDLSEKLIINIDRILKRNKILKSSLKQVEIKGKIDKNSTSYKILSAFKKGLSLGV